MSKQHIILDGIKINSVQDFHRLMNKSLNFGPYYGENLDALWDMMSTGMGDNIVLHWLNSHHSKVALGTDYFGKIISLFNDIKKADKKNGRLEDGFDYILK